MNVLNIKIVNSPLEAPNYNKDGDWEGLTLQKCIVVCDGMEGGNPSVDLQLVDESGKKYVAMITGSLLESAGSVIAGVKHRKPHDPCKN